MNRSLSLTAVALLLFAQGRAVADNPPLTVGDVAKNNGLTKNGWLIVKTPSILGVEYSASTATDPREAIRHYDRAVQLSADPEVWAESMRRSADLRLQLTEAEGTEDLSEVREAARRYDELLQRQPGYAQTDRVLYQLARARQLLGDPDAAIAALQTLGRQHPESERATDAHFRAGELLYAKARYAEAETEYAALMQGEKTPERTRDIAHYKYGWSLFKQARYTQSAQVFLEILDHDLPAGEIESAEKALAGVDAMKKERATEILRVTGLSFAALGGGPAIREHYAKNGSGARLETMVYLSVADSMLEKQRYTEAAAASESFIAAHPGHQLAPTFQARAIDAYSRGGFGELAVKAREQYAITYAPGAAFWNGATADPAILTIVHGYLDELGRYRQSQAQSIAEPQARRNAYLAAADWYRRLVEQFPQDAAVETSRMLYADALLEGGRTLDAARQYRQASTQGNFPRAAEAGLASVQAYSRLAESSSGESRGAAQAELIETALQTAQRFPTHPQRGAILLSGADALYRSGQKDRALTVARELLGTQPTREVRLGALGIIADAQMSAKNYAEAERSFQELAQLAAPGSEQGRSVTEQLASAIYRQGEQARSTGDAAAAAAHFQRVARAAPGASIVASADYDAAAMFMEAKNWTQAAAALESFRSRNPQHRLAPDADKKLALAYQNSEQPALAAAVYGRIAQRSEEGMDIRRESAWTAAQLFDQARQKTDAARAYQNYVATFTQPLERAQQARRRLADLAHEGGDDSNYRYWLRSLIDSDAIANGQTDATKQLAAQASLEIGQLDAALARAVALRAPIEETLARRKSMVATSIASLDRAARAGFAPITTAATYELGAIYRDMGSAVLQSQRPANLSADTLEQYEVLLEEQAFPFEEKAIQAHELNLQRVKQGLWNEPIKRSVRALAELSPAKYGKQEENEDRYDSLR